MAPDLTCPYPSVPGPRHAPVVVRPLPGAAEQRAFGIFAGLGFALAGRHSGEQSARASWMVSDRVDRRSRPASQARRDLLGSSIRSPAFAFGHDHPLGSGQPGRLRRPRRNPRPSPSPRPIGWIWPSWSIAPVIARSWRSGTPVSALSRQQISARTRNRRRSRHSSARRRSRRRRRAGDAGLQELAQQPAQDMEALGVDRARELGLALDIDHARAARSDGGGNALREAVGERPGAHHREPVDLADLGSRFRADADGRPRRSSGGTGGPAGRRACRPRRIASATSSPATARRFALPARKAASRAMSASRPKRVVRRSCRPAMRAP